MARPFAGAQPVRRSATASDPRGQPRCAAERLLHRIGSGLGQAKVGEPKFGGFGLVGKAGLVGLSSVLGLSEGPFRSIALCAGSAYRIEAGELTDLMRDNPTLMQILLRFVHVQLVVAGQIAACNAFHSAEERLARWLLTACYMMGTSELCFSQGTLAGLLGLRRPTVTTSLRWMKEQQVLDLQRRKITILNLERLEQASCRCHKTIRREIRNMAPAQELHHYPALLPPSERHPERPLRHDASMQIRCVTAERP